jgi:hypothetical protein
MVEVRSALIPRPNAHIADAATCMRPSRALAHLSCARHNSGGSRMHVYQWEPRLFETLPPPISFPQYKNEWTGRLSPGISSYAGMRCFDY